MEDRNWFRDALDRERPRFEAEVMEALAFVEEASLAIEELTRNDEEPPASHEG